MSTQIAPTSFKCATTLTAYRGVVIASTSAETVSFPETNTALPIGITADTARNGYVGVYGAGQIAKLYFNETMAAGRLVALDSSGRGVPFTVGTQTTTGMTIQSCYIGVLVGPAVTATGTIADVFIQPGFARGTS